MPVAATPFGIEFLSQRDLDHPAGQPQINLPPNIHRSRKGNLQAVQMQPDVSSQLMTALLHTFAGIPTARVHTQARDAKPGPELQ